MNKQDWIKQVLGPYLEAHPERKGEFATSSQVPLEIVYGPEKAPVGVGLPGEPPYTRGIHPTMYRGRLWTMRQYAGFSSARGTNQRFHYLLEQGQTGLSVAFDLPTQIGYESDHPLAVAEAGMVGVGINSLRDFEILFDGVPLDQVSTSMTINATAPILFCMYLALARSQGVEPDRIRGTVQNDILKEFVARGNYRFDVAPSMRLVTDLMAFQQQVAPRFNPISVSGYHMREAGCNAVQEVAFTLADGCAYLEAAQGAGLDPIAVSRRMSFFFNAHNNLMEEVAKFRVARRMWSGLLKERFGITDRRATMLRFHTQTGGSTLTAEQPELNTVRVAYQALAAVLGGTQSLHTNSFDEAIGLPTESSARLALRTQQVLAHETGVADVVDPLGGSALLEELTDRIEADALSLLAEVDRMGGILEAVASGWVQRQIHSEALRQQRAQESGEQVLVGVNRFRTETATPPEVFRPDPAEREAILGDLRAIREERSSSAVESALQGVRAAAGDPSAPICPAILEAVEHYATVGEICDALAEAFPPYTPPNAF